MIKIPKVFSPLGLETMVLRRGCLKDVGLGLENFKKVLISVYTPKKNKVFKSGQDLSQVQSDLIPTRELHKKV